MYKRVVTYDVKEGNDYSDFYEFVKKYNGKQITESTYEFLIDCDLKKFIKLIEECFSKNDNVYVLYRSKNGVESYKVY